ncbi:MAG: ribonuclease PH [Chloroflexi bacterium]|nr:ribonuclease PH [Chloroflexota bacterium]
MRVDGRQPNELRPVAFALHYTRYAEGSVLVTAGETRVLCNVTVEQRVPSWRRGSGLGWLTAEYAMLPRSTQDRSPRETQGLGGRPQEIRRFIGRSLRRAVSLEALGERTLILDCDVIQADGGTRTTAVTGGYVALALAVRRLAAQGIVPPQALLGPVAAVSAGLLGSQPLLDLCYAEDSRAAADLNVVMDGQGQFIEVQGAGERSTFGRAALDALLDLAEDGIRRLLALQAEALAREAD